MSQSLQQIYNQVLFEFRNIEQDLDRWGFAKESLREVFVHRCVQILPSEKFNKRLDYGAVRNHINEIIARSHKSSELISPIAHLLHDIATNPHHELFYDPDQVELFDPEEE